MARKKNIKRKKKDDGNLVPFIILVGGAIAIGAGIVLAKKEEPVVPSACPAGINEGEVIPGTDVLCDDGVTVLFQEFCINKKRVKRKINECPEPFVCEDGGVGNIILCPNGVDVQSQDRCIDNQWVNEEFECPPFAPCVNGTKRCDPNDDNVVQQCIGGQWQGIMNCEFGCANGDCVAPPRICNELATRCDPNNNNIVQQCQDNQWVGIQNCPFGCANGECGGQICNQLDTRCDPNNNNIIQQCQNNQWVGIQNCPFGCANGECGGAPQICNPREKRCNGDDVERCSDDGRSWVFLQRCGDGLCQNGECQVLNEECDVTLRSFALLRNINLNRHGVRVNLRMSSVAGECCQNVWWSLQDTDGPVLCSFDSRVNGVGELCPGDSTGDFECENAFWNGITANLFWGYFDDNNRPVQTGQRLNMRL